jgi:hypothetical protein
MMRNQEGTGAVFMRETMTFIFCPYSRNVRISAQ